MGIRGKIAVVAVLLAGTLPASALDVGRIPSISGGVVETRFHANPELGRAWIEVTVRDPRLRDESPLTEVVHQSRFRVPGLSFDAATSRIMLSRDGEKIACAEVEMRRPLAGEALVVRSTGRCIIDAVPTKVAEDDGFYIRHREQIQLRLQVPAISAG